jgi:predicted nucleotide-binding protein
MFWSFIHNTKTGPFVSTEELSPSPVVKPHDEIDNLEKDKPGEEIAVEELLDSNVEKVKTAEIQKLLPFRIFISHGKNLKILDQVKDVLDLYDIEYEIAIDEETTAIPVPQKVLTSMRRCTAGLMIVSSDTDGQQTEALINNNVLIEIGAAFVLYDQRVVLLWDKQLKVPSNLQGLYRCDFEGSELTFSVGTKLAKAMKGFRG